MLVFLASFGPFALTFQTIFGNFWAILDHFHHFWTILAIFWHFLCILVVFVCYLGGICVLGDIWAGFGALLSQATT